jgi:hypothetical protein
MLIVLFAIFPALTAGGYHSLVEAQRLFYSGQYDAAAAMTLELVTREPTDLAAFELRTSTLLFQLKADLGDSRDREAAFKACARCPELMTAFLKDTADGQKVARARLAADPADDTARFFLGKIDLNYVWLQLGELGHKTGWAEYWEARKSLDAVLLRHPEDVRARVARAWIDYIVDTKMPRGTRWILGGGNRRRALGVVRDAAAERADFFVHAEAAFALWNLQIRERDIAGAVVSAQALLRDFPENRDVAEFLELHGSR